MTAIQRIGYMKISYMNNKILTTAIIIFILILVSGISFSADKTDKNKNHSNTRKTFSDAEWLIFSLTKFQNERDLVIKANEDDIKDAEGFNGQKVRINVALYDIDGDNTDEIFAYFGHSAFCGARGNCALDIYKKKQNILEEIGPSIVPDIQIDKSGHQHEIGILKTKTLDHADIIIGEILCRWTGKRYDDVDN
jgi:hypothetical protein